MTAFKQHMLPLAAAISICFSTPTLFAASGNPSVNQVGFLPNSVKIATFRAKDQTALTWVLKQDNHAIATGLTQPDGVDDASGDSVHQIDFSSVNANGTEFVLHVGNDQSYPFDISPHAFKAALYDSIKYFYHNRSGIEIETPYTGGGNTSFSSDNRWARPAGHINQTNNQGDNAVPCWPDSGCSYTLDVTKGWYDAGDHGKYVVNGGIAVWKLLNMYERALHISNSAHKFADNTLNIPESGNGVADILDETRWQLEFLIAMQVPDGETFAGMAHHKVHDIGWTGLPLAPHEDEQVRALVPPSVTATLNLAAVGAQCSRIYANIDPEFANTCLGAAQKAWNAAKSNASKVYKENYDNGGGGYPDKDPSDEFFWAAAELYITTGNNEYLETVNQRKIVSKDWAWPNTDIPGLMSLAIVPTPHTGAMQRKARRKIIEIANHHVVTINRTGYMVPTQPDEYYWGSNNIVANKMAIMGLAYDFTNDEIYAQAFSKALNYLFGNNTLSFSFISGHGENALTQPHHRFWAGVIDNRYPHVPPGAFSGGPNSGLEDSVANAKLSTCKATPAKCFIDDIHSWSTNEITINWNSGLAWILAFYDDYADKNETTLAADNAVTCTLAYINNWGTGYQINVEVENNSNTNIDDWTLALDFGEAPQVSGAWNVKISTLDHTVLAQNVGWNGNLAPGESTAFGFQGNHDGSLNSPKCSVFNGSIANATALVNTTKINPLPAIPTPTLPAAAPETTFSTRGRACAFIVSDHIGSQFTGEIVISNITEHVIPHWEVNWAFSGDTRITNSWNANVEGQNPYIASNLGWNGEIQPGKTVSFGMQVTANDTFAIPMVTGNICD